MNGLVFINNFVRKPGPRVLKCLICPDPIYDGCSAYWIHTNGDNKKEYYHSDKFHDCFKKSGIPISRCERR